MSSVISLATYEAGIEAFRYLVLKSCRLELDVVFSLSPDVMRWNDDTWIVDLHSVKSYWSHVSHLRNLPIWQVIEMSLKQHLITDYCLVVCVHPWQGLCLMQKYELLKNQLVIVNTSFGKKLLQDLSWLEWLKPLGELMDCGHDKFYRKNLLQAKTHMQQLLRAMQRLGVEGPWRLPQAKHTDMAKRFGSLVASAWQWSFFISEKQKQLSLFDQVEQLDDFPWHSYSYLPPEVRSRNLEYPIQLWEQVQPLLNEDVEYFCRQKILSPQARVMAFQWEVVLYNFETVNLSISFRNPHDLYEQSPQHKTVLMQAYYGFHQLMQELAQRDSDLDLPEQMPLVSWKIFISKIFFMQPQERELFQDLRSSLPLYELLQLENKLPVQMQKFSLTGEFVLNEDFTVNSISDCSEGPKKYDNLGYKNHLGRFRPLFVSRQPKEVTEDIKAVEFLESQTQAWWKQQDEQQFVSEFYAQKRSHRLCHWLLRTLDKRWYDYGSFD